jgi:hypothetical protein
VAYTSNIILFLNIKRSNSCLSMLSNDFKAQNLRMWDELKMATKMFLSFENDGNNIQFFLQLLWFFLQKKYKNVKTMLPTRGTPGNTYIFIRKYLEISGNTTKYQAIQKQKHEILGN